MSQRRTLAFDNLDDIVQEVERLARGSVRTTGKHSFPQIVRHLAMTHHMMTGRIASPRPPLFLRIMLPFLRPVILNNPARPGFKLPPAAEAVFWPSDEIALDSAVAMLRESVTYYKQHGPLSVHPIFGKATREQLDRLACSHAAMHLSFVHPTP